jgi:hypothetical protein
MRRKSTADYVVRDCGYRTPCWVWQLTLRDGYGTVGRGGRQMAHRWYYERLAGPIPDGLQLDHLCRNRACVNPDHLEPVTHAENCRRGASAVLTPTDVRAIRQLLVNGVKQATIAAMYGIAQPTVSDIQTGRRWSGV